MEQSSKENQWNSLERQSVGSPDKGRCSGFKYPRRLCTQKIEKYVDIYGKRPPLSPVRTRSQTLDNENFNHVELPSLSPSPSIKDKLEECASSPLTQKSLISTSTPKRLSRSSGRRGNRNSEDGSFFSPDENLSRSRSRLGSPSSSFSHDGSRLSISSERQRRRQRHPEYDPTIEIRQAKERHVKYRSGKWSDTSDLYDAVIEDKERYKEKLEKRAREKGNTDEQGNPNIEMEEDDDVLARRQRDIDNGKTTTEYEAYVKAIPKPIRKASQPRTPNKFIKYSRRQWDGLVRAWRRHLHTWDNDTGGFDSFSSTSYVEAVSPFSDRESFSSYHGRKSGSRTSMVRRSRTPLSSNVENMGMELSAAPNEVKINPTPMFEDEDTMMGFPHLGVPHSDAHVPSTRRKRMSGQSNSNSNGAPNAPEPEALSTGLTADVGDFALNVRGTPTKRRNMDEAPNDSERQGGTPRKRARQGNMDEQSFAQIVKMNVQRGGGSPYKLRSQMRKAPAIQEEPLRGPQDADKGSYAQAARKLTFSD